MKKLITYYFFFLLSIFTILSSGVIDSQDGFQYLAVARNIYYSHEPTAPIYEYNQRKNVHMSVILGKDNKTYSLTGLGFSIAYLPAVAITDLIYKVYGVNPPIHFPLENDWLILLAASFTNSFFAAFLGVILFLYFIELGLSKKQALFISLIGLFFTNLLVYAKHSFAHMMFTAFLFASFFLIKKHFQTKKKLYLFFAGVSFGITSITYNQTFLLSIIPLGAYFLLLSKFKMKGKLSCFAINLSSIIFLISKFFFFFIGFIPFVFIYMWFESLRAGTGQNYANLLTAAGRGFQPIIYLRVGILFEGLFGQLFSSGRSVFLYSPVLLLIIFFRHRIKKSLNPEFFTFISLSIIYIVFYAFQYSGGAIDQGLNGLWHGEVSWGPRYLIPLIPLGMLVVGNIYQSFSKRARYFVFYPLVIFGLFIETLGVLVPYQTKLYNLQEKFFLNGTEYYSSVYTNLLPRYSPIINMSKNLVKLVQNFPRTLSHGIYNVRFYDGIDFPFNVGPERWRVIEGKGYISFDDNHMSPIKEFTFGLINHSILEASHSATLQFVLNNIPLLEKPFQLKVTQRELVKIPIRKDLIKSKNNQLIVDVEYDDQTVTAANTQILGLQSFDINGQRQNMESIDVPYVSSLGPKLAGVNYQNWGGTNQDTWKTWHIHTQMFERLPDLWWIRNLYYWDIPKSSIIGMFSLNSLGIIIFGIKLRKAFKK